MGVHAHLFSQVPGAVSHFTFQVNSRLWAWQTRSLKWTPFHPSLWLLDEGGREQAESNCGKALGRLCKDIFLITQCLCKPSAIKILLKVLARRTSPLENDTYKKSLPKQIVAWVPEMEKRFDGWEGNIKMSPHIRKQNESNHQNLSAREKQSVFLALKRPDILNQNQNTGSQKKEKDVFAI